MDVDRTTTVWSVLPEVIRFLKVNAVFATPAKHIYTKIFGQNSSCAVALKVISFTGSITGWL